MRRTVVVAAAVVLFLSVRVVREVVLVFAVRGPSMEPTFRPGDRLIARRRPSGAAWFGRRRIAAGDVVVLRVPDGGDGDRYLVKRVLRLVEDPRDGTGAGLWVEGDGRNSYDSRHFGPVPESDVVAVGPVRLWHSGVADR